MRDFNWDDLRFVLAVDRHGSLAAAARQLGVNESTVARRIAGAETRLNATLFERSRGLLRPTAAGSQAIVKAERAELEIQALQHAVAGTDVEAAGSVRLTSVPIVINRILVPALPALLGDRPRLRIELVAEARNLRLTKREADIALRLARPSDDTRAITRRIGRLDYAVYRATGEHDRELPWITYDDSLAGLPQQRWIEQRVQQCHDTVAAITVNDAETLLQSIKAGLGRSWLPCLIGDREPGLARLAEIFPIQARELWIMVHPDLRDLKRIRVVLDWLSAAVSPS